MEKRSATIGGYVTADHGWTLAGVSLTAPEQKTNYIEKTGGDGSWDLSTVMTDGIPRYKNRTLTVTLENSQGPREDREALISDLVNQLDGLEHRIELPDHPDHFLVGRVHVSVEYSTLAHARVVITGTVEPWFYKNFETVVTLGSPYRPRPPPSTCGTVGARWSRLGWMWSARRTSASVSIVWIWRRGLVCPGLRSVLLLG